MEIRQHFNQTYCVAQDDGSGPQQYSELKMIPGRISHMACQLFTEGCHTMQRSGSLNSSQRQVNAHCQKQMGLPALTFFWIFSVPVQTFLTLMGWHLELDKVFLSGTCPVCCRMLNIISELFPLDTSNPALPLPLVVAISLSTLPNVT